MVRVATLNQFQPGMSNDDLSDIGRPLPDYPGLFTVNAWESLRGWGQRLYRKADIVFLTEVRHAPHVRFLAQPDISGLPYYAMMQEEMYTDVAILSRYPLSDLRPIFTDGGGVLAATVTIEDKPHLIIGTACPSVTEVLPVLACYRTRVRMNSEP